MKLIYDPIKKLEALRSYIAYKVSNYHSKTVSFDAFLLRHYPKYIFGTAEYYRDCATNCYYCQREFHPGSGQMRPTVDHFFPKSLNFAKAKEWKIFVICCSRCNTHKANMHPLKFIGWFNRMNRMGQTIPKFNEKDIKRITKNVNQIHHEVLMGCAKKIYYKTNDRNRIPIGFTLIHQ